MGNEHQPKGSNAVWLGVKTVISLIPLADKQVVGGKLCDPSYTCHTWVDYRWVAHYKALYECKLYFTVWTDGEVSVTINIRGITGRCWVKLMMMNSTAVDAALIQLCLSILYMIFVLTIALFNISSIQFVYFCTLNGWKSAYRKIAVWWWAWSKLAVV